MAGYSGADVGKAPQGDETGVFSESNREYAYDRQSKIGKLDGNGAMKHRRAGSQRAARDMTQ